MATTAEAAAGRPFPRLHWGAVIAGVLLALAAHVVMGLIGAALGFAARPSDSRALGVAAAIWALLTPFVATFLGAWLACRMADADDARAGSLHGVLVWCIGLIAGALFLTGTIATGAMTAGTAASGNAGAMQRAANDAGSRAATGRNAPARADRGADQAAKGAAEGAGAGALAAIAGLLGGICGAALSARRGRGAAMGRGWTAFRRDEARAGTAHAGDRGFGTTYGGPEAPRTPGTPGTTTGPGEDLPPTDPYHH